MAVHPEAGCLDEYRRGGFETRPYLPDRSRTSSLLRVGGLQPFTTLDYPGELAAVVFCQGCPWGCRYCQNGHLLPSRGEGLIPWDDIIGFLRQRKGLLDALVLSGGEPTLQPALPLAIQQIKALGFKVGLHTAGCFPERLARVLPLLDWVGLDIKALPQDYPPLTGVPGSGEKAWRSLGLLLASGIAHEVRVTVHETLLPPDRLADLIRRLSQAGVRRLALQECQWRRTLDSNLGPSYSNGKDFVGDFGHLFECLEFRPSP
ncbi:MAG: anaerobic ribonucleoside-triphosphate reductase activating protein [Gammaproteobacteria bacterium]|nr:anaerobic ribonucleoside-triphosphate reductase activating protein [Gammaproteobacteria bacterium]MBU1655555.1 anaerobic ribonucleoside-triphosphate reductase activating protein [Gammaproteobacteria bacterium]MBU1960252.1 anaerobic ribonucleoside-triphosphate reductase activating protein [Gammaproteobacteria bacterium]